MRITHLTLAAALAAAPGCLTPRAGTTAAPADRPAESPAATELPPPQAAKACLATAGELERRGFDADAIALYEKARQLDGRAARVAHRLAVLYDRCGNQGKAAAEFEAALAEAPDDADSWADAGGFHAARGDWAAAEDHLGHALRLNPGHARARVNLGVVYVKTGRVAEGEEAFAKALSPAEAAYNVGVLLAGVGRPDEARAYLRSAAEKAPGKTRAEDLLARMDATGAER